MYKLSADDRFMRAIRWVSDGQVEEYRSKDPVHFAKNYASIKSQFGIQRDFTFDRRQFDHFWIYSRKSGCGKSAIVNALWPYAYVLSNQHYFEGFNPLFGPHRVVVIKDINSRWFLDYGVQQFKQLTDLDGHNVDVKYAGGDRVNHGRVVVTSNFTIEECLSGTDDDKIVGFHIESAALHRRFIEIEAEDFLALAGVELKTADELRRLKGSNVTNYWNLFNIVGINCIAGYGEEGDPSFLKARQLQ